MRWVSEQGSLPAENCRLVGNRGRSNVGPTQRRLKKAGAGDQQVQGSHPSLQQLYQGEATHWEEETFALQRLCRGQDWLDS